jgi:NAD(P)-dependent dehydrogenase (short-subunit alcohol dehydrogenase family)
VTGAGSGIGKASAMTLAATGHAVVLAGRRQAAIDAVASAIEGEGGKALAVATDVGDPASVEALFKACADTYGRLDVLFNNAGTGSPAVPMDELPISEWQKVVNANLNGTFYCTRAAFGMMRHQEPQGGRIINNGSISAYVPRPYSAPYTATKHAVTGMTRSTSLDGRQFNIVCSQIDIGNAATEMTERMTGGVLQADFTTKTEPRMDVRHVADMVAHIAGLPLEANVQFVTVMATKMPFIGRG